MIDYSIKFNGTDESKRTIRYSTDSKFSRKVVLSIYNRYLKYKEYEEIIEIHPNTNHWTYSPSQLNHRCIEFKDEETSEIVGLFGIDGLYEIEKIDNLNYVKNIFDHLDPEEKNNVYSVLLEISTRNTYHNSFVCVEEDDLVVDIGFNYGLFSLESLKYNPLKIIGFEPNPKLVSTFKNFINVEKIELHQKAVSNMNGNTVFYEKINPGLSSIFEEINFESPGDSYPVEIISFNDFIIDNKIEKINYLKVDCEGSEYAIFDSIPYEYLSNNIKKIAIEFHHKIEDDRVQNLINKLKICGFSLEVTQDEIPSIGMIYGRK